MKNGKPEQKTGKDAKREERAASLKEALRQNLHKRKAQSRARADQNKDNK